MTEKNKQPTTTASPARTRQPRRIQNFLVVWLDASIDEVKSKDCQNTIAKLNEIVKDVNSFTDVNACVDFLSSVKEEKAFLISSGAFGPQIVSVVSSMVQVSTVYIFCPNGARHDKWGKDWPKVGGSFTEINPICEALKKATSACDQNLVSISLVAPTAGAAGQGLDQLNQTFMYTQILKEILLAMDFDSSHIKDFIQSSRILFADDTNELKNVDKLEREYTKHSPIWWYTYQSFLYSTLNRALRLMEVDLIVSMGFFVRHLHEQIASLHMEQFGGQASRDKLTVFRGQSLAQAAFDQLLKIKGGLLSFNNFLSTSTNRHVSFGFARQMMETSDSVGIVFVLNIDPTVPSTPFANVRDVSYFKGEDEILFSMHSIFRIGEMKQVKGNNRLWEVDLTLTSDDDSQLRLLTNSIRKETTGYTGWHRLGKLMHTMGKLDQTVGLNKILLSQATTEQEKAYIYNQLGLVTKDLGKYSEAIIYHEKSIGIKEQILPPTDPRLAPSYNNIGEVYQNMGEYSKALQYYEKALTMQQKALPLNHPHLATSYNNIGSVYDNMDEYSKALEYHEQALAIRQKTLPSNHPDLACSYNNIGLVCNNMAEYSKALQCYEKAVSIWQKTLPSNHPNLACSYNNIGLLYCNMKDYCKALSFLERALDIGQRALPANHPNLQNIKQLIADVKKKL